MGIAKQNTSSSDTIATATTNATTSNILIVLFCLVGFTQSFSLSTTTTMIRQTLRPVSHLTRHNHIPAVTSTTTRMGSTSRMGSRCSRSCNHAAATTTTLSYKLPQHHHNYLASSLTLHHRRQVFWREQTRLFSVVPKTQPEASTSKAIITEDDHDGRLDDGSPIILNEEYKEHPKANGVSITDVRTIKKEENEAKEEEGVDHLLQGLKSRPVPGGNWNIQDPLGWAQDFGRRSEAEEERLASLIRLQPGDEGYFELDPNESYPGITLVRSKEQAQIVLEKLMAADTNIFHACDTEVMEIDLKTVGPVGNGYVTCVSIYSGPDFDYGLGDGPGTVLWIDNLDDACGVLQEFKDWFENENYLKVWHNYGFDRHVMWNEGILVQGFGGDTMHMARLQNTARSRAGSGNGYGLAALTEELLKGTDEAESAKVSMKELFGVPRTRKDGSEGSLVDIPPVEVMQRDPRHRQKWIEYSCKDAKGTWLIREKLEEELKRMSWFEDKNLFDYYFLHMRPFGEVLTDMERRGVRVDARDYLAGVEVQARKDRDYHCDQFRKWAKTQIGADGLAMNPASATQLQTFLFGGSKNAKTREHTEPVRVFKVPREEISEEALEAYRIREDCAEQGTRFYAYYCLSLVAAELLTDAANMSKIQLANET